MLGRKAKATAAAATAMATRVWRATESCRKKYPIRAAHKGLREKNMMAWGGA
jgi:hypothetical protein